MQGDIQRGKLVGQQGPGSLYIDTDGSSYIISAADKWYNRSVQNQFIRSDLLEIHDARLERILGVNKFLAVPSYRTTFDKEEAINTNLRIPINRFPLTEYCSTCGTFRNARPTFKNKTRTCSYCEKKRVFVQFPLVILCDKGHIEEFPYYRYVHAQTPHGDGSSARIWLDRTGPSILSWTIRCTCGAKHSLTGITGKAGGTSPYVNEMKGAKCHGKMPWTGSKEEAECDQVPIAVLRNSLNVYRPELVQALSITDSEEVGDDTSIEKLFHEEFLRLTGIVEDTEPDRLKRRLAFTSQGNRIIQSVSHIDRLQEIIVQTNFHRNSPGSDVESYDHALQGPTESMLFSKDYQDRDWYPAKLVYGEGIFLQFNAEVLECWEKSTEVLKRFESLMRRTETFYMKDWFTSPSSVLIHTISHALIKELSRHSGYPMTAIKERLYLQEGHKGLLLYVTDPDKAGTYGGLVRLASEKKFKTIFYTALNNIDWCSSDPVCYEFGETSGQGINYSNGAACHNCCFVPSTACGYRNCYLDRDFVSRTGSETLITKKYKWFE